MTQSPPLTVTYFSDILCVWAYVAQARLAEIHNQFGGNVAIGHRFCSVFASSADKIGHGWAEKGGYEGFNRHLREVAVRFEHIDIHPDVWLKIRPASSDSAHLFIRAVQILERNGPIESRSAEGVETAAARLTWIMRRAFFHECRDISTRSVQCELAEESGLPVARIEAEIDSGAAFAALAEDYQSAQRLKIEGSPTFVLDEGRQKLYGNVGYRVIEANIQELLRSPHPGEMSWC